MSFLRPVENDIFRELSDTYFPGESAILIPLLHYRAIPNPKLTREANRTINPGEAEAAQSILTWYWGGISFLYWKIRS